MPMPTTIRENKLAKRPKGKRRIRHRRYLNATKKTRQKAGSSVLCLPAQATLRFAHASRPSAEAKSQTAPGIGTNSTPVNVSSYGPV